MFHLETSCSQYSTSPGSGDSSQNNHRMIAEIHNLSTISANSGEAPEQRDATEIGRAPNTRVTVGLLSNLGTFVIRIRILCILHVSCMYSACILMCTFIHIKIHQDHTCIIHDPEFSWSPNYLVCILHLRYSWGRPTWSIDPLGIRADVCLEFARKCFFRT